MDLGAVIIAVAGVTGTLVASVLTQLGAERAKRREIELVKEVEDVREDRTLRRACYTELNRDARQFTTALTRHLHLIKESKLEDRDIELLDEAKSAYRDQYSAAQMIAPDDVLKRASAVNQALNSAYGRAKRLEQGTPRTGETLEKAFSDQEVVWISLREMRKAMRRDLGVSIED